MSAASTSCVIPYVLPIDQAELVYLAEWEAFKGESKASKNKLILFYASVVSSEWFIERYPNRHIAMEFIDSDCGSCYAYCGLIQINNKMRYESSVIHELTHAVALRSTGLSHGRKFCKKYIDMVGYFLPDYEERLIQAFNKYNVKY